MLRLITPIILIALSIGGFVLFVSPMYKETNVLKEHVSSYNQALDNSKALENERDKLTKKYSAIDPVNLDKLQKLLPDNVDNIRLILEIEKIASPYGMILKDVKYETESKADKAAPNTTGGVGTVAGGTQIKQNSKEYGTWDLGFSIEGKYNDFINFTKDLESNLRIVDIASIQFNSDVPLTGAKSFSESYKYSFKVKTYWLKN